jgi:predicted nucleic acid-binding protein
VTAYHAMYAALAETLGCELVTGDQRLARAHGLRCVIRVPDLTFGLESGSTVDLS